MVFLNKSLYRIHQPIYRYIIDYERPLAGMFKCSIPFLILCPFTKLGSVKYFYKAS